MSGLTPDHLLAMATTNPAKVLGVGHELGTLEAGKLADLIVLDVGLSALPIDMPLANVIYSMGSRDVTHVMVDGSWVVWNRDSVLATQKDLRHEYQTALTDIRKRVGFKL
jgi:5-methylthioadenosine/S-adenosylhomocysteine deaminase